MKKTAQRTLPAETMQSWLSVVRVYHLCEAVLSQRLGALGLKLPEHELLVNLLRYPGLTQQQLAQRCFVAKSGISMLVTRMVDAGRVQREADAVDARVWRLTLTPEGRALAERSQQVQAGVIGEMTEGSSPAEQKIITDAMERASWHARGHAGRSWALTCSCSLWWLQHRIVRWLLPECSHLGSTMDTRLGPAAAQPLSTGSFRTGNCRASHRRQRLPHRHGKGPLNELSSLWALEYGLPMWRRQAASDHGARPSPIPGFPTLRP